MEPKILDLKKLNAAYIAAQEFDYCPDSDKSRDVVELFNTGVEENDLNDALNENQGRRPDEIMGSISNLILELK